MKLIIFYPPRIPLELAEFLADSMEISISRAAAISRDTASTLEMYDDFQWLSSITIEVKCQSVLGGDFTAQLQNATKEQAEYVNILFEIAKKASLIALEKGGAS